MARTQISNSMVIRYSVDETTRISMASWQEGTRQHYAVCYAFLHRQRWILDGEDAAEFSGDDAEDVAYRATVYASRLVAKRLGECPLRFFRDNAL